MQVITFYSYKGGVGRTLLVTWIARALAAEGKRVALIDLDLEAPGLHYKLVPGVQPVRGVVDILSDFAEGKAKPSALRDWFIPVPSEQGSIHFLPAGNAPSWSYWRKVRKISWTELQARLPHFFRTLREEIEHALSPDILLVDARTGVTEMGGGALSILADKIIAVTTTSNESKHGLRNVLRAVVGVERPDQAQRELLVLVSRFPVGGTLSGTVVRDQMREFLNEPGPSLRNTLRIEDVAVIRHDDALLDDELRVLEQESPVVLDYTRVLDWLNSQSGEVHDSALESGGSRGPSHISRRLRQREAQLETVDNYRAQTNGPIRDLGLAESLLDLSLLCTEVGARQQALDSVSEAVELLAQLADDEPDQHRLSLMRALQSLGRSLAGVGQRREASERLEQARRLADATAGLAAKREFVFACDELMTVYLELGQPHDAHARGLQLIDACEELVDQDPTTFGPYLADTHERVYLLARDLRLPQAEALESLVAALTTYDQLQAIRPEFEIKRAGLLRQYAELLLDDDHHTNAQERIQLALSIHANHGPTPPSTEHLMAVLTAARVAIAVPDSPVAFEQVDTLIAALSEAGSMTTERRALLARAHDVKAELLSRLDRLDAAITEHQRAIAIADQTQSHTLQSKLRNSFGVTYWSHEQPTKALAQHKRAFEIARSAADLPLQAVALANMGLCQQKPQDSLECYEKALSIDHILDNVKGQIVTLNNIIKQAQDAGLTIDVEHYTKRLERLEVLRESDVELSTTRNQLMEMLTHSEADDE